MKIFTPAAWKIGRSVSAWITLVSGAIQWIVSIFRFASCLMSHWLLVGFVKNLSTSALCPPPTPIYSVLPPGYRIGPSYSALVPNCKNYTGTLLLNYTGITRYIYILWQKSIHTMAKLRTNRH